MIMQKKSHIVRSSKGGTSYRSPLPSADHQVSVEGQVNHLAQLCWRPFFRSPCGHNSSSLFHGSRAQRAGMEVRNAVCSPSLRPRAQENEAVNFFGLAWCGLIREACVCVCVCVCLGVWYASVSVYVSND